MSARIYADHAATTPVRDEVAAAMAPFNRAFNPNSLHAEGRAARAAIDEARATVARLIGAKPREIVFTSGGTEADNLALFGAAKALRPRLGTRPLRVLSAPTEHHAVLHALDVLRDEGAEVSLLAVDRDGAVAHDAYLAALDREPDLVCLMLGNNELGTIHPVASFAGTARARGALFHCDAVAAANHLALDVDALDVNSLAISAHKFYGPKGIGALYVLSQTPLAPLIVGGSQERGLRAGTENVAAIVGLATALELAVAEREDEARRVGRLRDAFEAALLAAVPGALVNGAGAPRLPHVSSVAIPGVGATELVARLDLDGAAISAGSACASGVPEPSHVVAALAPAPWVLQGTVRFSLGKLTSGQDVARLANMVSVAVTALREPSDEAGYAERRGVLDTSEVAT